MNGWKKNPAARNGGPRASAPGRPARWRAACTLLAIAFLAFAPRAQAKIDLVTIPARDRIQMNIYNSEDLTLVRESRNLTFKQGANQIQFSWANTLIDPTSLQLAFVGNAADFSVLDITYPANTQNVLIWNVEAAKAASAAIEITYFTSGLTWRADYVARANPEENEVAIESYVRVVNSSGEDFENAEVRLVVGAVNLVDKIAELARRGIIPQEQVQELARRGGRMLMAQKAEMAVPASAGLSFDSGFAREVKEVVKQAISEYQLYTIEGTEDLSNGWSKRLRSFSKHPVKIEVAYELDERKYGPEVVKLYRLKNDAEHGLGENPLPEGMYRVFRETAPGADLAWGGSQSLKYIPVGEKIELNLGPDGKVLLDPRMMDFSRRELDFDSWGNVSGYVSDEPWTLEIRNSNDKPIPVKIRRYFGGDWSIDPKIDTQSVKFKKVDRETVEFEITVAPLSTSKVDFTLTRRHGTRSSQENNVR